MQRNLPCRDGSGKFFLAQAIPAEEDALAEIRASRKTGKLKVFTGKL
jgi:hypothetical protein